MNDSNQPTHRSPSLWRIRLSTLILLVTIFAVLAAWFVDHRQLRAQIKPPEIKTVVVYKLSNASAQRVIDELTKLYPKQEFIHGSVGKPSGFTKSQQNNSVIVSSDTSVRDQIDIIMRHFDRKGTDLIDAEQTASEVLKQEPAKTTLK